jgi:glutamate dehydrogenase (NAD(P)+)
VQGFGNVGRYAALAAAPLGCRVIGVSDVTGALHNDAGFKVEDLIAYSDAHRGVKGFADADEITPAELLAMECDCLIPAAVGGVIHRGNVADIRARVILEGANGPTTLEADAALNAAGVTVVPDVLANAGGVTVSYFGGSRTSRTTSGRNRKSLPACGRS